MKKPIQVAVTGAAGAISYSLLFRIASGQLLGEEQPISLRLIEVPAAMKSLAGVVMELIDCSFPCISNVNVYDNPEDGFRDVEIAFLIGARPRGKGMERSDLLKANAAIFSIQGAALNQYASRTVKVLVVGNPANTNALIAARNAPDIDPRLFTSMSRLDHNRAMGMLAEKLSRPVSDIEGVCVWGNHSLTQFPDISMAKVAGDHALDLVNPDWYKEIFIPQVAKRGGAIIDARGASSAASAAHAALEHMRDWIFGSKKKITSMGVPSDGSYGIPTGLIFSFPVVCSGGDYSIVKNFQVDLFSRDMLNITCGELTSERDAIAELLPERTFENLRKVVHPKN